MKARTWIRSECIAVTESNKPVAVITGGSSGLGLVIADRFLNAGYRIAIVGRNPETLAAAAASLGASDQDLLQCQNDVGVEESVAALLAQVQSRFGRLDVLVNCVGGSDRGLLENLSIAQAESLFHQNVVTTLLCCKAAITMLEKTSGVIVNIGSLGGKVGARYIGGYALAKHAVSGLTQQLRLELKPKGIHVGLVSPGPIRRSDEGKRYENRVDESLPEQANQPGGGTKVKGLAPERVAAAVSACVRKRKPDVVLPGYLRVLIAVGNAFPRLGDWLLLKFTSSGNR